MNDCTVPITILECLVENLKRRDFYLKLSYEMVQIFRRRTRKETWKEEEEAPAETAWCDYAVQS